MGIFTNKSVQFKEGNDLCLFDEYIECIILCYIMGRYNINILNYEYIECIILCYIMGSYNINILNYESKSATAEFVDTMYAFSILPLINRLTRIMQCSATLIENISITICVMMTTVSKVLL